MVDARLPDGSRVNAIIKPLALDGPHLSIRKFKRDALSAEDLLRYDSVTEPMLELLNGDREGPAQRADLGRHRRRQDDAAQHPVVVHPGQRAHRHHRGLGRASAPAAPRRAAGDPAGQHRGHGRGDPAHAAGQRPAYAARPDHHGRVPRRRGRRHAPGHEHRPRRLADHPPRQHAARRAEPARDHDRHGRPRPARAGHAAADRQRHQRGHPGEPPRRRHPQGDAASPRSPAWKATSSPCRTSSSSSAQGIGEGGEVLGHFKATGIRPQFADRLKSYGIDLASMLFSNLEPRPMGPNGAPRRDRRCPGGAEPCSACLRRR